MKRATIYFNGTPVQAVEFEKMDVSAEGIIVLYIGYGDSKKTIAVVPRSHLIIAQ